MTTHAVDADEIQTTRGEKALAVVLGVFILIGLVWAYDRLERQTSFDVRPSSAEQQAIDVNDRATRQLGAAIAGRSRALADVELRRERYRTALDAGQPAPGLERDYATAEQTLKVAEAQVAVARARVAETQPAANAARERQLAKARAVERRDARVSFLFRMVLALAALGLSYALLARLRGSRYLTLGLAAVGASAVLALVFTGDYVEDHVAWRHTGPLALSAAGIVLSVGAFWGLQRYLRRQLPHRRVRKRECPFCGFPAGGDPSCEGCGRAVVTGCASCGGRRRVGVPFCGSCGSP
ncbi:MAG TPA: zinc ribbon domain-containing protein [Gaiella sp.]|jgi:hypothetical protein